MKLSTKELILCGIFAALTAILAQISIPLPFTTIPLTLQIVAIGVTGIILGSKCGFISILIYILIGAMGVPVFAGFKGGLSALLGPTGGFILGFPIMVWIIGYVKEKFNSPMLTVISLVLGLFIDYITGTILFSLITGNTIINSIMLCVIPFIIVDFIKLGLAYIVGTTISKRVSSSLHTVGN